MQRRVRTVSSRRDFIIDQSESTDAGANSLRLVCRVFFPVRPQQPGDVKSRTQPETQREIAPTCDVTVLLLRFTKTTSSIHRTYLKKQNKRTHKYLNNHCGAGHSSQTTCIDKVSHKLINLSGVYLYYFTYRCYCTKEQKLQQIR